MDSSNIPHPPLLTPSSVSLLGSSVFGSAPFQDSELHILNRVTSSSEMFGYRGDSIILGFINREFMLVDS